MSQEDVKGSADNQSQDSNQADGSSETVSAKAYREQQADMFKYKDAKKAAELELNRLKAELKAREDKELADQNRYEELWKKSEEEKKEAEELLQKNNELYMKAVKKSHLKSELGGNVKDAYLNFADVDGIDIDDNGVPNSESILAVANKFRKEYPELVGSSENANITDIAATNNPPANQPLDLASASDADLREALLKASSTGSKF